MKQTVKSWLAELTESGEIPGLVWLNGEKTKLRLPWPNGKTGWKEDIQQYVFVRYAIHRQCKLPQNTPVDKSDGVLREFKQTFRCAINKSKELTLCDDKSLDSDPHKVYQIVEKGTSKRKSDYLNNMQPDNNLPVKLSRLDESYPLTTTDILQDRDVSGRTGTVTDKTDLQDSITLLSDQFKSFELSEGTKSLEGHILDTTWDVRQQHTIQE